MAEAAADEIKRPIRRAAVHDDDFMCQVNPLLHGFEVPLHQREAVEGREDYADGR